MNNKRITFISLIIIAALSLLFSACDPAECDPGQSTRTEGCDQFRRVNSTVYKGSASSSTLPVFSPSGWHPLQSGDKISTDASGMAELNFSGCWPGQLFCFQDSSLDFQVATCNQVTYEQTPLACVPNGSIYSNGPCPGEYMINTGSAQVIKTGTVLSINYLPERRNVTLVIVLEGSAQVNPVAQEDPLVFAEAGEVEPGQFYFTMPDDQLSPIGGLEPRQVYPLPELPPVAEALGILDWMFDVRDQAQADGVLPDDWPAALGGEGVDTGQGGQILVNSAGGPLDDPRMQEAFLMSVPWQEIAAAANQDDMQIRGFISGDAIDLLPDFPYDPVAARELRAEAGYDGQLPLQIFYPPDAPGLSQLAEMMLRFLPNAGFDAQIREMPDNLDAILGRLEASGQGYVLLNR